MTNTQVLLSVLVAAIVTAGLRFAPFLIFGSGKKPPAIITYLGKVLPFAIMGMLVVYCLKGVSLTEVSSVLPAALGVGVTAGLHLWKHNTLLSILGGTAVYMLLVQMVF